MSPLCSVTGPNLRLSRAVCVCHAVSLSAAQWRMVQLLREATAKMTSEKAQLQLREAEQAAAITCLKADLQVAQQAAQRAQQDAARSATAAASQAAVVKSAADADLAMARSAAAAAAAEVSKLEGVVRGLQQQLQAAKATAEKSAADVAAHSDSLQTAEGRCQQLQDALAQQVRRNAPQCIIRCSQRTVVLGRLLQAEAKRSSMAWQALLGSIH